MAQFYTLEEAARVLGMSPEELRAKAQAREVRAFLDGGSWRFRVVNVDELARRRGLGSDFELRLSDLELVLNEVGSETDLDLSEFRLGGMESEVVCPDTLALADTKPGVEIIDVPSFSSEGLAQLSHWIRARLVTDHVRCSGNQAALLQDELRRPDSPVRGLLAGDFHRLVLIEGSCGLNRDGEFEFDRLFLRYLKTVLLEVFEIERSDDYHPEQISQILKDEPRSLFCFLDAQLIPDTDAQRLRSFTQEFHRVLFCGAKSRPSLEATSPQP